jgi:hypothetical protein
LLKFPCGKLRKEKEMKHLKLFGAAVGAAMAMLAVWGGGAASATVLCKTNSNPCAEKYLASTSINASIATGTEVKLVDSGGFTLDICKKGQFKGKILSAGSGAETVTVQPEFMSYENCAVPLQVATWGTYELHSVTGTTNGTLTVSGQTIYLNSGECTYVSGTGTHAGVLTGGVAPTIDYSLQLTKTSGPCIWPSARLTATYSVTSPTPLYVEPS